MLERKNLTISRNILLTVLLMLFVIIPSTQAGNGIYIQRKGNNGIICIEAENFKVNKAVKDHKWELTTEKAGYSGKGAMISIPDNGKNEDLNYSDTPYLDYKVYFADTGKYYIWVRGWGKESGNSVHLDLDHRKLSTASDINFDTGHWDWVNKNGHKYAFFKIDTAGFHTVSLSMREDGMTVDKIVLTTKSNYKPEGNGPIATTEGAVIGFASFGISGMQTAEPKIKIPVELACSGKGRYSVDYSVVGGTADSKDYILKPGALHFGPGETRHDISLDIAQGHVIKGNKTVVIKLSHPKGKDVELGSMDSFTYTIIDPRPVVEFKTSSTGADRYDNSIIVPVKLSFAYNKPVTLQYNVVGGTANSQDYSFNSREVTFEPGQVNADIQVSLDKNINEKPNATIILKLLNAENAIIKDNKENTIGICGRSYDKLGKAVYFRFDSGKRWEKYAKVGRYADAMVPLGDHGDRVVFWRGASYLPFLETADSESYFDVLVPKKGNGEGLRFDKNNQYSNMRIVENTPARVTVEWRYLPDFNKVQLEDWTEEYFTIYPDGVCYRSVKTGTKTLQEYNDPSHVILQRLLLTNKGIFGLPKSWIKPFALKVENSTKSHFSYLGFDRIKGSYNFKTLKGGFPGSISFRTASSVDNPALFVKNWGNGNVNIKIDGQPFNDFKIGYVEESNNNDLILWFNKNFRPGSEVTIDPVGGSPVVRKPVADPYLSKVPLLPEGSVDPGPFKAYYTTLKYWDLWDNPWRVGNYADIVVQFDKTPDRFVIWRGTDYTPCWVNDENHWYNNEFCERRGNEAGYSGTVEPMRDYDCRYSSVQIIHNSDARVVVHWRYSPVTMKYQHVFVDSTGWGDWADEYYYIYPDETCIRDATLYTSAPNKFNEWNEEIPIVNPGTIPDSIFIDNTLSLANASGKVRVYNFKNGFPPDSSFEDGLNIVLVGLRGKDKPFAISQPAGEWFDPISRPGDTRYNQYDDWPAWPRKYLHHSWGRDPKKGNYHYYWKILPSHSSLMHLDWDNYASNLKGPVVYLRKILLNGMTNSNDVRTLIPLTKYWENPPLVKVSGYGFSEATFDKAQKAYQITRRISWIDSLVNRDADKTVNGKADTLNLKIFASKDSPLINPCIVIHNWPDHIKARLFIDGKETPEGKDFRQGFEKSYKHWQMKNDLVLWIRNTSEKVVDFKIKMIDFPRK